MNKFFHIFSILCLMLTLNNAISQTQGTLNFSASISTQSGSYGAKHYVAIWIEDANGVFVKTKNRFGASHANTHLCQWKSKSTSNLTDATSGATRSSYATPAAMTQWNGTNVAGVVVPDGVYKVWIEAVWDDNTGNCGTIGVERQYASLAFTKGTSAVHLTGQVSNIFTMSLDWVPAVTVTLPTVTTTPAASLTTNSAISGGVITSDGGANVTARGVCWGTTADPVVNGNHTSDGTGIGTFTSNITGLTPATTYHYRAYAINSAGTAYGADMTFSTLSQAYTVSGQVVYNNTAATFINGATVNLMNGTTVTATTTTNIDGFYSFQNVANGNYTIEITTDKPWGGTTATDVLKIKRHVAGMELLTEPIRLSAADPNLSNTVTSTDALKVSRRVTGLDATFTRPDWIFELQTTGGNSIVVAGANITANFFGVCTGDVNGSNTPVLK